MAYFPDHLLATGSLLSYAHPHVEFGFITSVDIEKEAAFVRYYWKHLPDTLRTKSNSERTSIANLWPRLSRPQPEVNELLAKIEGDK